MPFLFLRFFFDRSCASPVETIPASSRDPSKISKVFRRVTPIAQMGVLNNH